MANDEQKKRPAPKGPSRKAVDTLQRLAEKSKKASPPKTPPPDELPEDWGLADLVRVGKSRLKRAIYGPPKPEKE